VVEIAPRLKRPPRMETNGEMFFHRSDKKAKEILWLALPEKCLLFETSELTEA
jgi:hypothetical protein